MLAVSKDRVENQINELKVKLADSGLLEYDDKYGWEAKKAADEEDDATWNVDDVSKQKVDRLSMSVDADEQNIVFGRSGAEHSVKPDRLSVFSKAEITLARMVREMEMQKDIATTKRIDHVIDF